MIIEEYFKDSRVGQSRLKKILIHPQAYLKASERAHDETEDGIPKECLLIGNAVDCMLTEHEKFSDKFVIDDGNLIIPTGQFKEFIDELFVTRKHLSSSEAAWSKEDWVTRAVAKVDSKRYKLEDFIAYFEGKLRDKEGNMLSGKPYWDYLVLSSEKYVLTLPQYDKAVAITESFISNQFTKGIFEQHSIKQLEIFWHYEGLDLKSKLDMVVLDHERKRIIPIDVKTTEYSRNFEMIFWKNRYDFQAASYTLALEAWKQLEYPDYTISDFLFVVEGTTYIGNPLIYRVSPETFKIGKSGGVHDGRYYEGFDQAVERAVWHENTGLWSYKMEEYRTDGVISI